MYSPFSDRRELLTKPVELLQGTLEMHILKAVSLGPLHGYPADFESKPLRRYHAHGSCVRGTIRGATLPFTLPRMQIVHTFGLFSRLQDMLDLFNPRYTVRSEELVCLLNFGGFWPRFAGALPDKFS
jgi:hypothetical protein